MKKKFKKSESVSFKNKKEKKQLLNIALEYGFKWMSGKEVFDFEPPTHSNVLAFFRKSKKIGWAVVNDIEKNTPANKFIKRFEKTDLEKRVDAIEMEVVTLKNKGNDPLVNIDFNELSFEEAHKQAYESICKYYGITDTEVKGVTFNPKPLLENGWYKFKDAFLYYFDFDKNTFYGFRYNSWIDEDYFDNDFPTDGFKDYTKATTEEVEQRLIEEAKRRGFLTKGNKFKSITSGEEGVERIVSNYIMSDNTKKQITLSIDEDCDNILRYNNGLLTHDGSKRLGCSNPYIYRDGKWAEVIAKENKEIYLSKVVVSDFKPVFMKCTQEQFDRMRPKLESAGCVFDAIDSFNDCQLLLNNYCGIQKNISNSNNTEGRTEVHTEAEFLEACGYVEEKIEYTLENIQVDCRGLSEEKIKEMAVVFENAGYKKCNLENFEIEKSEEDFVYLRKYKTNNDFALLCSEFTTITYEKFIELFSEKPIEELHAEHKEAKREPKVGDVVKAWSEDESDSFVYGKLEHTDKAYLVSGNWYKNIEVATEININDFKK